MVLFLRASGPILKTARTHRFGTMYETIGFKMAAIGWNRSKDSGSSSEFLEFKHGLASDIQLPATYGGGFKTLLKILTWFGAAIRTVKHLPELSTVHACDLEVAVMAALHPATRRLTLIYDICDFRHQTCQSRLLSFIFRKLEVFAERRAALIILPTESRIEGLQDDRCKNKVVIIRTGPAVDEFPTGSADTLRSQIGPKRILFFGGTLGADRGILTALEAVDDSEWQLVVAGFGAMEQSIKDKAKSSRSLTFLGPLQPSDLLEWTSVADAILMTYDPAMDTNRLCAPNKVAEALLMGKRTIYAHGMVLPKKVASMKGLFIPVTFGDSNELRRVLTALPLTASDSEVRAANDLFQAEFSLQGNARSFQIAARKARII